MDNISWHHPIFLNGSPWSWLARSCRRASHETTNSPAFTFDGSLEGAQIQWKSNVEVVNISCYLMVGIYPRYPLFVFKNGWGSHLVLCWWYMFDGHPNYSWVFGPEPSWRSRWKVSQARNLDVPDVFGEWNMVESLAYSSSKKVDK